VDETKGVEAAVVPDALKDKGAFVVEAWATDSNRDLLVVVGAIILETLSGLEVLLNDVSVCVPWYGVASMAYSDDVLVSCAKLWEIVLVVYSRVFIDLAHVGAMASELTYQRVMQSNKDHRFNTAFMTDFCFEEDFDMFGSLYW
jgi:hypothetical protein